MNTIKLGVVGIGKFFTDHFMSVFRSHPGIGDIYLADFQKSRAEALASSFDIAGTCKTLDELIAFGVNAVAIFTPRDTHAALAQQAMEAGLHVYMAVPAAVKIEELAQLIATSARTRRICMTGETSFYYPEAVYCREEFATGRWGKFVHADAQYIHDHATWGPHFLNTYGESWRRFAAIPPMYYATHSFSLPLSITGARVTHVASRGFVETDSDRGYGQDENPWQNRFSNEVAFAQTSDGGTLRIGEFRRLGWFTANGREVMMPAFYCTDACFEENSVSTVLIGRRGDEGGRSWHHQDQLIRDLSAWVEGPYFEHARPGDAKDEQRLLGLAPAHHADRLPSAFRGIQNGHNGSHHFLVDDFVRACQDNALPPTHIWNSAVWTAPGLIAHESSKQSSAMLAVPDFGHPPADWNFISLPPRGIDARRPSLPPLINPIS